MFHEGVSSKILNNVYTDSTCSIQNVLILLPNYAYFVMAGFVFHPFKKNNNAHSDY